ncbi:MAG: hypothetical protein SGJ11_09945 [Phycisphaerae bacterium]|nr:hypothetical protein [Phycisphaerae bacterium]
MTQRAARSPSSTWIVLFIRWISNGVIVAGSAWTLKDLAKALALNDRDGGPLALTFAAFSLRRAVRRRERS